MYGYLKNKENFGLDRIGDSKFYFGVWYNITDEKALVPCGHCGKGWDMDCEKEPSTYLVGDYSREKFNAVKFELCILDKTEDSPLFDVTVFCFADTRKWGVDTIAHITTTDIENIDKRFFDYTAEVLSRSGAVVDVDLNTKQMQDANAVIARWQKYNQTLAQIIKEA